MKSALETCHDMLLWCCLLCLLQPGAVRGQNVRFNTWVSQQFSAMLHPEKNTLSLDLGLTQGHALADCWYETHNYFSIYAGIENRRDQWRFALRASQTSDLRKGDPAHTYLEDYKTNFTQIQPSLGIDTYWIGLDLGLTLSYSKNLYYFRYDETWRPVSDPGFENGYFDYRPGFRIRLGPEAWFFELNALDAQLQTRENDGWQYCMGYIIPQLDLHIRTGIASPISTLCRSDQMFFTSMLFTLPNDIRVEPVYFMSPGGYFEYISEDYIMVKILMPLGAQ